MYMKAQFAQMRHCKDRMLCGVISLSSHLTIPCGDTLSASEAVIGNALSHTVVPAQFVLFPCVFP